MSKFEIGVSWERPNILPIWEAQVRRDLLLTGQLLTPLSVVRRLLQWSAGYD